MFASFRDLNKPFCIKESPHSLGLNNYRRNYFHLSFSKLILSILLQCRGGSHTTRHPIHTNDNTIIIKMAARSSPCRCHFFFLILWLHKPQTNYCNYRHRPTNKPAWQTLVCILSALISLFLREHSIHFTILILAFILLTNPILDF